MPISPLVLGLLGPLFFPLHMDAFVGAAAEISFLPSSFSFGPRPGPSFFFFLLAAKAEGFRFHGLLARDLLFSGCFTAYARYLLRRGWVGWSLFPSFFSPPSGSSWHEKKPTRLFFFPWDGAPFIFSSQPCGRRNDRYLFPSFRFFFLFFFFRPQGFFL